MPVSLPILQNPQYAMLGRFIFSCQNGLDAKAATLLLVHWCMSRFLCLHSAVRVFDQAKDTQRREDMEVLLDKY